MIESKSIKSNITENVKLDSSFNKNIDSPLHSKVNIDSHQHVKSPKSKVNSPLNRKKKKIYSPKRNLKITERIISNVSSDEHKDDSKKLSFSTGVKIDLSNNNKKSNSYNNNQNLNVDVSNNETFKIYLNSTSSNKHDTNINATSSKLNTNMNDTSSKHNTNINATSFKHDTNINDENTEFNTQKVLNTESTNKISTIPILETEENLNSRKLVVSNNSVSKKNVILSIFDRLFNDLKSLFCVCVSNIDESKFTL